MPEDLFTDFWKLLNNSRVRGTGKVSREAVIQEIERLEPQIRDNLIWLNVYHQLNKTPPKPPCDVCPERIYPDRVQGCDRCGCGPAWLWFELKKAEKWNEFYEEYRETKANLRVRDQEFSYSQSRRIEAENRLEAVKTIYHKYDHAFRRAQAHGCITSLHLLRRELMKELRAAVEGEK